MDRLQKAIEQHKINRSISIAPGAKFFSNSGKKQDEGTSRNPMDEKCTPLQIKRKLSEVDVGPSKARSYMKITHKKLVPKVDEFVNKGDDSEKKKNTPKDIQLNLPDDSGFASIVNFVKSIQGVIKPRTSQVPKCAETSPPIAFKKANNDKYARRLKAEEEDYDEDPANIFELADEMAGIAEPDSCARTQQTQFGTGNQKGIKTATLKDPEMDMEYFTSTDRVKNANNKNKARLGKKFRAAPDIHPKKTSIKANNHNNKPVVTEESPANDNTILKRRKPVAAVFVQKPAMTEESPVVEKEAPKKAPLKTVSKVILEHVHMDPKENIAIIPGLMGLYGQYEKSILSVGDVKFVEPNFIPVGICYYAK